MQNTCWWYIYCVIIGITAKVQQKKSESVIFFFVSAPLPSPTVTSISTCDGLTTRTYLERSTLKILPQAS